MELALLGATVRHEDPNTPLIKNNVQMCVFACFKIKLFQFREVRTDGAIRQGVARSLCAEQWRTCRANWIRILFDIRFG